MTHTWFDAHLDLAYLALLGRDMGAPPETQEIPDPPACITLPGLATGRVTACLATVFTEPDGHDAAISYTNDDSDAAHAAGTRQLDVYDQWRADGLTGALGDETAPLQLGVLIENADPIRTPEELHDWVARGVVAIGMTWRTPSRYAGGDRTGCGLTDAGRDLADAMDALGVLHDLSHLSQRSTDELLAHTDRLVIASHSNCRTLLEGSDERHLNDTTIREIARRGGVIGLNLYSRFLRPNLTDKLRATIDDCVAHVEHICELVGSRAHVGLGSDADGGFSAARLPEGINSTRDYTRLLDALRRRGWSDTDLDGFAHGNWRRVIPGAAP